MTLVIVVVQLVNSWVISKFHYFYSYLSGGNTGFVDKNKMTLHVVSTNSVCYSLFHSLKFIKLKLNVNYSQVIPNKTRFIPSITSSRSRSTFSYDSNPSVQRIGYRS